MDGTRAGGSYLYLRHRWPVRLMHWINVVALTVLLMSGLMIFNAHPSLAWGASSYTGRPAWLEITAGQGADGRDRGLTRVLGHTIDTTGVLGLSRDRSGMPEEVAFPWWMTVPSDYSLADARRWHFFFAWVFVLNGLAFVAWSIASGHLRRDLLPTRADWRGIGRSVLDHLRLRHPQGEAARHYNVLQKLAYLGVVFGLLPLMVLAGWAMSPWIDSLWPGWVAVLGGRQSARSEHFVIAWLLVAFVGIHVFEVIVSGLWNHLRSMVTGRYRITPVAPQAAPRAAAEERVRA